MQLNTLIDQAKDLPAVAIVEEVNNALLQNGAVVITAPPGAGKSTLLPLTMLKGLPLTGKIIMLEPRRIAARHIAQRMAYLLGEEVGETVGYRVRFDNKVSSQTRLEVVTEGILSRMLIDDATLDGVSVVIFDEFHERNINADLAFALTRQVQQLIRDDLKIVVMSATIDATTICQKLQAPLIESKGRIYNIETFYSQEDTDINNIVHSVLPTIREAHDRHEGDILVFLPGQADITRCYEALGESLAPTKVYPLYGNLSLEEQQKAIAPSASNERKIVLATPIAETSLTIEGVRIVIDSGYYRKLVFNPRTGLSRLETVMISKDMAQQRSGRAGRITNGFCYRLWTKQHEALMTEQRTPEIIEADLTSLLLNVAAFGETNTNALPWLTLPPQPHIHAARNLLTSLGAIDNKGQITSIGRKISALPCHPRIAKMLLKANTPTLKALACDIAAILEEKDPLIDKNNTDLSLRISTLRSYRRQRKLNGWFNIAQIAKEYRRLTHAEEHNEDVHPQDIGLILSYAFPERIAKATNSIGHFKTAGGNVAYFDNGDDLAAYSWVVIASMNDNSQQGMSRVFLAAPLDINSLESDCFTTREKISWTVKDGGIIAQKERCIGQLVVSTTPLPNCDNESIIRAICNKVKKDGASVLNWNDEVRSLQLRIHLVSEWHPELHIPDVSTDYLLSTCMEWLPFYLTEGNKVRSTLNDLKRIDIKEVIWALIPYELQNDINRLAPTHIQVPTGSHIRIDYRQGAEAPIVSVRLQECFGLQDTPRVNDGKQPVLMELLSPGFKPVQLTQDLRSFWDNAYFEVRKELRRRYPKHAWPDNPLKAQAVRGVKRKS